MKRRTRRITAGIVAFCACLLILGIVAPHLSARRFAEGIRAGLERSLGRKVDIGDAHFDFFTGPGFALEKVVIHEDPAFGLEPAAYVISSLEAVPRIWPLLRGRLEFASIRLDEASINLMKTGPASEPGHWNFEPLLTGSRIASLPEIQIRNSRINFKFGNLKSVFYFTNTDLDISPPSRWSRAWSVQFSGEPARTDRPARGFGSIEASGAWEPQAGPGGRLNLDLELRRSNIGEIIALVHGQHAGVHGTISSRMHLAGPPADIKINGRVFIEDVHRWDLLPPKGEGWPLGLEGRLDLLAQKLELVSSSSAREALPLTVRFRASNYLSQPHWGLALNWNRFPLEPLLELARHMGAAIPPGLNMSGAVDGAIGCEDSGSPQGELAFHDAALTIPGSPPVRFEKARLLFEKGHAHLSPAIVRTADDDEAQLEADYRWDPQTLDMTISTAAMRVGSLRSQVALAAVPWLEQVPSGTWRGQLRYQCGAGSPCGDASGWTGRIELTGSRLPLPGLAEPVELIHANAQIHGPRIALEHLRARIGKIDVQGEYRYEPEAERPHRVRLLIPELDATALEHVLEPTLRRSRSLIARALGLGRAPLPQWLRTLRLEGDVRIDSLLLAGSKITGLRGRLAWDAARFRLNRLQAHLAGGTLAGNLAVNLRGAVPSYLLAGRIRGMDWKSGKLDLEGAVQSSGLGSGVLANLRSAGVFTARALDFDMDSPIRLATGAYRFAWAAPAPQVVLSELQLAAGNEVFTGRGSTQPDGRLLILLTSGAKEMRMSGTLASLRMDEALIQ